MTPIALYGRIRAQAAWNLLTQSRVPAPITAVFALGGVATAIQFANLLGSALASVHLAGADPFSGALGALLSAFQLVFSFVVVGSVSIRMFDPRKAAELDVFAALPLRRVDRFLIQVSDVAAIPVLMLLTSIVPALILAAVRGGMTPIAAWLFVILSTLVCFQPVPALIALYAVVMRFTPPALLKNRALLFVAFGIGVLPLVPILSAIMSAWHEHRAPSWLLPAGWATAAVRAAESGHARDAVIPSLAVAGGTALLCLAAFVAFDRVLLERFDEILARLAVFSPPDEDAVRGHARPASALARFFGWVRARLPAALRGSAVRDALTRKEVLALARDPALQLTLAGLGASAFTFAIFGGRELGLLATGATGFLAVYMAACLGLASFSQEGRGLPVLAPLPLAASEVLRAKLVVNTAMLGAAGFCGGAVFGVAFAGPYYALIFSPPAALLGAATALPLGGLVTAMGALFPRRLQRTGRREISGLAMSFFTALSLLFYASILAAFAAPLQLGPGCAWMPPVVIAAWSLIAAALVSAANKAVRRGRFEG